MANFTTFKEDTIVAPITPAGKGAIGVIRISGKKAISICSRIFKGKNLEQANSHTVHVGIIHDEGKPLDEVVVTIFKEPHSFTKENTIEISCHGSSYILNQIIQLIIKEGARLAQPGEFTQRAFLNGRIDLTQAEAIADLIASESEAAHNIALKQMRGGFSNELKKLRDQLIQFASLIELELDFSEEDVEFANRDAFINLLHQIEKIITSLIQSFKYGSVIKEGIPVAIIGKPNAGKSSLLNALLNEERAIVSPIAGTTRDSIEDTLVINGIIFRFIDTAGLRETDDIIESIGVKKAKEKAEIAKIVLYLFDKNDTSPEEVLKDIKALYKEGIIFILVQTKLDTTESHEDELRLIQAFDSLNMYKFAQTITAISIYRPELIQALKGHLVWEAEQMNSGSSTIITNTRHLEALQKTNKHIAAVQEGLKNNISKDFLSQDIRLALRYLGEITGEVDIDKDILGTIFSKFCIGK